MNKINLDVFNTQPPHLYFGGVERRIMETAQRLRNDVNTTVYSGTKAGFKTPTLVKGINIVPTFSTDRLFPVDNWFFNKTIANSAERLKADIYEVHTVSGYGFLNAIKKKQIKKPFIHTIHGVLADEYAQSLHNSHIPIRSRFANLLMKHLANIEKGTAEKSDLIVTVSTYSSKKAVEFYNLDLGKIRVVPNGVNPEKFKPIYDVKELRLRLGLSDKLCVLFVGRLIPRKGLSFLVEAARKVVKQIGNTTFLIVGDGPLREYLVSWVDRANLSGKFVFLGDVNENALPLVYNCADVFVLPSVQEGQGIALLEAQATGKPIVAFKVGGVPEAVIEGESGLLTKPDSFELSKSLLKLLSDASLREKMGTKGRAFVMNNFSWDICAQKMLRVYREAKALFA